MEAETVKLPDWARALGVIVGILSLVAGFLVLIFPGLGILTVVYFLAFALIMIGVERLAMGITGHAFALKMKVQTPAPTPNPTPTA
jgi:uncharacterized membrane protein HdeD (DUF308 family)